DGERPSAAALRAHMKERLPEYMIPPALLVLDAMPLTPNGKVDRNALAKMETGGAETAQTYVAPRAMTEELIAAVWSEVLRVGRVGVHDDFFEIGGHSLVATQAMSRLAATFNVHLPLRALFEARTVAALAERVESARRETDLAAPPLEPVARGDELPLSFAQQRLWFLNELTGGDPAFNIFTPVRITGRLDAGALAESLNAVVARHESLRTVFSSAEGQPVQVILPRVRLSLPLTDLGALPEAEREAEVRRLAADEARRLFDLAEGPLLRAALLRLGDDEHVLLLTMHHIVSDAWSMAILIEELSAFYTAFAEGRAPEPAELPIQYADFAVWQRAWLRGEVLEAQLSYWKRQLAGLPSEVKLPTDRPRPEAPTSRGAMHRIELAPELSHALRSLSRAEGVTLFTTVFAAFSVLLRHYTAQDDFAVGADVANRNRVETEGLIGFFVNQLVLRANLSGDPDFRELLRRAHETALDAYAHQDVPFEKLVNAVRPERGLNRSPLFNVKITLQNAPPAALEVPGVTIAPLELPGQTSQLDLILALVERGDRLEAFFNYSTELFDEATVARMARCLTALLERVARQPEARMSEMEETIGEVEKREREGQARRLSELKLGKLKGIKPKAVGVSRQELVSFDRLSPDDPLPLVARPAAPDVDVAEWARDNRELVERQLLKHGALLFRGFAVNSAADFERLATALCPELFDENGEHPRKTVSGKVYTPVFYPADQKILWHNENSFNHRWPMKIWFGCVRPADRGGETPLADSRRVYEMIPPDVRERFVERGVMYVRRYGEGLGLGWREVFRTSDKTEVERRCRENLMSFEWEGDEVLKTFCVRPAAVRHPRTGETVWFNQAQHWHVSCLDPETRASVRSLYEERDLPRNCYYGDGSRISDSEMGSILDVYQKLEVAFPWRERDVVVVDNLLTAHARNPFAGERRLLVAMGEMLSYDDVESPAPVAETSSQRG
ncbi:MAG TPA: condensation domain-containing protein, partial [Pyrinomonadaceae bacterium]|nr:condensation domain-containing protein [Pyrinomonadaceae bacterium]